MLDTVAGRALSEVELTTSAVRLAELLQDQSERERSSQERGRVALLARLMHDEVGQAFTTLLTDRVYRSRQPDRIVDAARYLLRTLGTPTYLPALARGQLQLLLRAGPFMPEPAARGLLAKLRSETREVVISSEPQPFAEHLHARRAQRVRINVNELGEAVLGETEAQARLADYQQLLARPDVEAISVKVSSIASRSELLAWEQTLADLRPRLRSVYEAALAHHYLRSDGTKVPKLVSADMEAYRDLRLMLELFCSVLDEPALRGLTAGIVLQAYLPDSFELQQQLTQWAQRRVAAGGAPVRLRIVKGANLAAERVESELRGWPLPIYGSKLEVDASYKRMVEYGCRPEHARAVHLGLASHNVFDLAFGLLLREANAVQAQVGLELLEGMADPLRRALQEVCDDVLLYCPVVADGSMQTAIAYLTRRLDENAGEDNFLRHSFGMQVGDAAWTSERERFEAACALRNSVSSQPRRTQDRGLPALGQPLTRAFDNEPDTDFSLAHNRRWITQILERFRTQPCFDVAMQVGGQAVLREPFAFGFDPSRPQLCPYRYTLASADDLELCLATASRFAAKVSPGAAHERAHWLASIATGLRNARGELIATMLLDAGKRVEQADAEVSEAIDFAEYYSRSYLEHAAAADLRLSPKGVVLVTPPWNFPLAIPAGGVFAALMAGNAVILKPALETVLVGAKLAELCWAAGVPREALQLLFCADTFGSRLIRDARVQTVVLTGATSTARLFHELRPGLDLLAETGGKNAIIVSAMADRDAAIKEVLSSAFGHAGQKCSAASLLICEAEVYDDPPFRRGLQDAVESLPVGSAWDLRSIVTPLIRPPSGALLRALTTLEPGESWLVQPRVDAENPCLWSAGVKLDVQPGSFTHTTELFGPVLGMLRAEDLDSAIELANATPYGLTAGLFSLDEREQRRWVQRMQAGNLYINRGTTGAIVRRQPFGGWKASSFGPGAKAGGPNYVLQLSRWDDAAPPAVAPPVDAAALFLSPVKRQLAAATHETLARAACAYAHELQTHFAIVHDPSYLLGEVNRFHYVPCASILIRAAANATLVDALRSCVAALTAGVRSITLSVAPALGLSAPWLVRLPGIGLAVHTAAAAAEQLGAGVERVRALGDVEPALQEAAVRCAVHIGTGPVCASGRVELLHYFREQSISNAYHRYGNLQAERLLP
ncbi:MAG TPA: proline dehydrogenase family protein [Polyangiales bacterium]